MFRIREQVNLRIYKNKDAVIKLTRIISLIAAVVSMVTLAYLNGFQHAEESREILHNIIRVILIFFVFNYLIRIFYSFDVPEFIRETWIEGFLMLLIVYDGISFYFFDVPLLHYVLITFDIENIRPYYLIFIQVYILVIAGLQFVRANPDFTVLNIKPSTSLILSLFVLLMLGTILLMMPEMTVHSGSMPFLNALFTSVSAISQTGLIVVDTATYFTYKGHFIIMVLIQVGAVGIISFGTFFGAYISKNVSLKKQYTFHDFFISDSSINTTGLFVRIMYYTILIDLVGSIVIFFVWDSNVHFDSLGDKIFSSVFHAISAFCGGGFTLFTGGTYSESLRHSYLLHLAIAGLVFVGSLGYPTLVDLFRIKNLRDRLRKPWKRWTIDTVLSVYTALGLLVLGIVFFFFFELNNTLASLDYVSSFIASLFQTVMRTAGFNTVDISALTLPTAILMCFLMFIGGASGSVCGGIRTSTFAITMLSFYSGFRGRKNIEIRKRLIPSSILYKAVSIVIFAFSFVFLATFLLSITEPNADIIKIVFEEISAFGTVGLSMGLTSELSTAGKIIIMVSMFVGRVGTLTIAFALSSQIVKSSFGYPNTNVMIG